MRSRVKLSLILFLTIVVLGCKQEAQNESSVPVIIPKIIEGNSSISTENYANRELSYYYACPNTLSKKESVQLLIYIPGLSGNGASFVPPQAKDFAIKHSMAIIAPSFQWDQKNWSTQKSYQYPSVWSGEALLQIVEQFSHKHNVTVSGLYLTGFSAGAQFSQRFALYRPELCKAVVSHASGGTVIPQKYQKSKFLVTIGNRDTEGRLERANLFYSHAKKLGIDVTLKRYEGGHSVPPIFFDDGLSFFEKNLL